MVAEPLPPLAGRVQERPRSPSSSLAPVGRRAARRRQPAPSLVDSRRRCRPAPDVEVVLASWCATLGIRCEVWTERISRYQVTGPDGRPGASLVGVVRAAGSATIYHTRALTIEDVVHELLHVAHPDWGEAWVVAETERLLLARIGVGGPLVG